MEAHDHRVTVGPNGRVQAGIKSREIVAQGTINGNVEATDKIDIKKDARLVGDIKTARIVIEDGAYFQGQYRYHQERSQGTASAYGGSVRRSRSRGDHPGRNGIRRTGLTSMRTAAGPRRGRSLKVSMRANG